jgi:ubiquinone biosynthesis protein UbiJ
MKDPASAFGERIANGLIGSEAWAREKLRAYAGRSFRLRSGPVVSIFSIAADGRIEAVASRDAVPDAEIQVSPFDAPALLAAPERWESLVTATGDAALIATLRELATTLPWFVERSFARTFGPVAGQRIADAGRALLGFPGFATHRFAENVFAYARDEAGVLARGDEARALADEHAALADRVDRLLARVDRLTPSAAPPGH